MNITDSICRQRDRLSAWLINRCPRPAAYCIVGITVGLATGLAAWMLKMMIGGVTLLATTGLPALHNDLRFIMLPLGGILLTGFYQRHILHRDIDHGIERVRLSVSQHIYRISPRMIYAPMLASTITLGLGGSAGSEGPIATTGAAIGSNIGRLLRLSPDTIRTLIGCGAGAAIAGIFKAPVGGMLFTLEVLGLPMTTVTTLALLTACLTSAMTAYALSGCTYAITFIQTTPFTSALIPWSIVIGIMCGLYSIYYSAVMRHLRLRLGNLTSPLLRNIVSGSILAVCIFTLPTLYGEGYDDLSQLINNHSDVLTRHTFIATLSPSPVIFIAVAALLLFAKPIAACATNSGGGVAGDFAPTLFAGAIAGYLIATLLNTTLDTSLPVANCAYIGMAAVMAGVVRAPLMALFLTSEMADGYQYFLPLLIAVTLAHLTPTLLTRHHHMPQSRPA